MLDAFGSVVVRTRASEADSEAAGGVEPRLFATMGDRAPVVSDGYGGIRQRACRGSSVTWR